MKQFVKDLPKTGNCFKYLCKMLPHLSEAKLKEGVFIGPDIRKLMFDEDFLFTMTEVEREAWIVFRSVVAKLLWNNKDPDYVTIVANMLDIFKVVGCLMSLKIHFFEFTLGFFYCAVSEEEGERFHQDIKEQKENTMVGGMLTRWVTTSGCYIVKFWKPHIRGRATYAALPAREKDSTRPLNKI
jgi:hypothetical protein